MAPVNQYGSLAWQHWQRWRPTALSRIEDPETFFARLGIEVADQIHATASSLAGDDPGGESYQERLGRLTNARFTAEETVLREMVLLPQEPGNQETEPAPGQEPSSGEDDSEDQMGPREARWQPIVMTPDHPSYHDTDDDPLLRRVGPTAHTTALPTPLGAPGSSPAE